MLGGQKYTFKLQKNPQFYKAFNTIHTDLHSK